MYDGRQSSFKNKNLNNHERRNDMLSQSKGYALTSKSPISKRPPITCHYCGLIGHMKVECEKR